jgi:YgiT-type zinc finger domain-containing protein
MNEYNDCFYCGGGVKEITTSREIWWKGQLHIFEKVPMGVCSQCGEKVLKPKVAKVIDSHLAEKTVPDKFIQVPVHEYKQMTGSPNHLAIC